MQPKILITSGCSFTETVHPKSRLNGKSWADWLAAELPNCVHVNTAQRSHGNGLISRSLIWSMTEALKTHDPSDILVGVMWSGPWRHDFFVEELPKQKHNDGVYVKNPTNFVENSNYAGWIICNHSWHNPVSTAYYDTFWSMTGSLIYTIEHILRVQWFCEKHKIPYFMTTHTKDVFLDPFNHQQPDVHYLYQQIDFDHFLPVVGEHDWVREHLDPSLDPGVHPSTEHHRQFTKQVVLPFLEKKYNVTV